MKGFFLLLVIFSFQSCTKWYDVKEGNGILYVDNAQSEVHSLKEIEWDVGQKRDETVSKGFQFKFDIPKIKSSDASKLINKHGIDSWVFKITKHTRGRKHVLGKVIYNLTNISRVSNNITVHIFYHAAAVSQPFRRFKCPAFNHRFRLNQFDITQTADNFHDVFARRGKQLAGRLIQPSFAPVIFSGDVSLAAKYTVEFALYNSTQKKLYSRWYKANNTIDVATEDRVAVPSCNGIKEENNTHNIRPPRAEEFRIK